MYPTRVHAKVLSTHLMPLRGNAVSIRLHTKYMQFRHPLSTGSLMSTTKNPAKRVELAEGCVGLPHAFCDCWRL